MKRMQIEELVNRAAGGGGGGGGGGDGLQALAGLIEGEAPKNTVLLCTVRLLYVHEMA